MVEEVDPRSLTGGPQLLKWLSHIHVPYRRLEAAIAAAESCKASVKTRGEEDEQPSSSNKTRE